MAAQVRSRTTFWDWLIRIGAIVGILIAILTLVLLIVYGTGPV